MKEEMGQDGDMKGLVIRQLGMADLQSIMQLQEQEEKFVSSPDQYVATNHEEFTNILTGQGLALGAFRGYELIGFTVAYFPGSDEENLGNDLRLSSDRKMRVAHLEAAIVDHRYRGRGIQKLMIPQLIELVKQQRKFDYLMATAAPYNYGSIKRLLSEGLVIKQLKQKYEGKWRFIFWGKIDNGLTTTDWEIEIDSENYERQIELLSEGYEGVCLVPKDKMYIGYRRPGVPKGIS